MTTYADQTYNIRVQLDTKGCELSEGEISKLEESLAPLRKPVRAFPISDLHVLVEYEPPSEDYRVKLTLQLPGRGLATGDVDDQIHPAFRRCVRKLVHKLTAYKERLGGTESVAKHEKGTRHDVIARREVDTEAVGQTVRAGDYARFRTLLYPFEEPVRMRAGRWIQRYAKVETQLGQRFDLADIVEEVFLNAFERYDERPQQVSLGDWLEELIDPSVKLLGAETDEELSNISFARSALEAQRQRERSK